ncbi:hypothetical protein T459_07518 [Capsicum annuum]|uniref:F-box domain-containing protein n=1 Tax=Capsicum annuum TaxID=4072 RepID=A0A2G2ZTW9_CAPAN|nr:hypothetical protein T459_07518 [Capsicum annuum]
MHNNKVPHDIIIEILLKLPAKSLLRFKGVCKSWRSLIEDSRFINLRHDRCKSDINSHKFLMSCKKEDHCYYYSVDAPLQHDSVVSLVDPPNVVSGINYDQLSGVCFSSRNSMLLLIFPYDEVVFVRTIMIIVQEIQNKTCLA